MEKTSAENRTGLTLVELSVSLALTGVVLLGLVMLFQSLDQQQSQATATFQIGSVSRSFVSALQNRTALSQTLTQNPAFQCIANSTNCVTPPIPSPSSLAPTPPSGYTAFTAYDRAGNIVLGYDPSRGGGFTASGQVCHTFVAPPAQGNDACPFQLALAWTPLCPSGGCLPTGGMQMDLRGTWTYNPRTVSTVTLNVDNYDFDLKLNVPVLAIPPPPCIDVTAQITVAACGTCLAYGNFDMCNVCLLNKTAATVSGPVFIYFSGLPAPTSIIWGAITGGQISPVLGGAACIGVGTPVPFKAALANGKPYFSFGVNLPPGQCFENLNSSLIFTEPGRIALFNRNFLRDLTFPYKVYSGPVTATCPP